MVKFRFLGIAALMIAGMMFGLTQARPASANNGDNDCTGTATCNASAPSSCGDETSAHTHGNSGAVVTAVTCGFQSSSHATGTNGAIVGAIVNGYHATAVAVGNGKAVVLGGAASGQNVVANIATTGGSGGVYAHGTNPANDTVIAGSTGHGSVTVQTNENGPTPGQPTICTSYGGGAGIVLFEGSLFAC